jgi:phenylacetic acid degradation protein
MRDLTVAGTPSRWTDAGVGERECVNFPNLSVEVGPSSHIDHGAVLHGCRIGHNATVGMNAVVMDETEVGEDSIVAALAFVKTGAKIPPRSLAVGSPARVTREVTAEEIDWKIRGTAVYQRRALESRTKLARPTPSSPPSPTAVASAPRTMTR